MQSKKRQKKIYEKIASFLEFPCEAVSGIPVFIIRGRHEIEVSGCCGITEYSDCVITVTVGRDRFTVCGSFLEISDFRDSVLYIRGNIRSASFEGGVG